MKTSALIMSAVASGLMLVVSPLAAYGSFTQPPVVPEPSAILIWVGIAVAGGVIYWWRNHRQN